MLWLKIYIALAALWCVLLISTSHVYAGDTFCTLAEKITSDDRTEKGWALVLTALISFIPIVRVVFLVHICDG